MGVELQTIPQEREIVIVVGTSVRKAAPVLQLYLDSLAWQELPPKVRLIPCFVPDWPDPNDPAKALLDAWVKARDGVLLRGLPPAQDFREGPQTHEWSVSAMHRVGHHKNLILQFAAQKRADYVWFADADLVMDRTTLWSLYHVKAPIVAAVYWTRWQKAPGGSDPLPAGPQVWLRHPYELSGRGLEEAEFRRRLTRRELTPVWGQGACTLLERGVWEAGVSFSPAEGVPQEGMMAGEDRQFCIQAERKHIPMIADPWPDIYHVYHLPADLEGAGSYVVRLGGTHPGRAHHGDLVSLVSQPLEPLPQPNGSLAHVGPVSLRGRLGQLDILPDLEAALLTMTRGETRIVKAKCGLDHPIAPYRGQSRLFRVTLVDCKPWGHPPVLEDDLGTR